jgi:surface protein
VHQHGLNEASATTRDGLLPVHQLPMFYTAAAFNEDISAWNTAKVITTNGVALAFLPSLVQNRPWRYRYRGSTLDQRANYRVRAALIFDRRGNGLGLADQCRCALCLGRDSVSHRRNLSARMRTISTALPICKSRTNLCLRTAGVSRGTRTGSLSAALRAELVVDKRYRIELA